MKFGPTISKKKQQKIFYFALAVFLVLQLNNLGNSQLNWDESVYLKTAHFLQSNGEKGLLENLRPIGFPILLAFFPLELFSPKFIVLITSILTLILIKLTFEKLLSNDTAFLISIIIMFFPEFINSSKSVMAAVPAMFFYFAGLYLLINLKYQSKSKHKYRLFFIGVFTSLSFFIRHIYGIYLLLTSIYVIIFYKKEILSKNFRPIASYLLGCIAVFFIFGIIHYNLFINEVTSMQLPFIVSFIYPIWNQVIDHTSKYVWYNKEPFHYYLQNLWHWTPFSLSFILGFLIFAYSKTKDKLLKNYALLALILPLIFLFVTPHKEFRYLLVSIPWIIFFAVSFLAILTKHQKSSFVAYSVLLFILFNSFQFFDSNALHEPIYNKYYDHLADVDSSKIVLTATPIIETNAKLVIGYYDDLYFYNKLIKSNYDYVYYTTESFPCQISDSGCFQLRKNTLKFLDQNYEMTLKFNENNFIYAKK